MNKKTITFITNISYTLISNFISLFISTLIIFIVPKLIDTKDYGYWQLYLFYSSYVGFLHFGWASGIYLKYGGKEYSELDKGLLFSQFHLFSFLQIIIASFLLFFSSLFIVEENRLFIIHMTAICLVITNIRTFIISILQATNKIKEYAKITIIGRIVYVVMLSLFLLFGFRSYKLMVVTDLIGRFISLIYALYCCNDIVFRKVKSFCLCISESFNNICIGIKLMFSNIASMLIIGLIRFGIERSWSVSTFGEVSLTLSISNLLMIFINALGIIMYPILKRTNKKDLSNIYIIMRDLLMFLLLGILIIYYPLKLGLEIWLPKYKDSLVYMSMLLPVCVFEGKMSLLINTFLKTLRKETLMLKINFITLCLSFFITIIIINFVNNLNLAILSIVFLLSFRSILSEIYLSSILKVSIYKDILLEVIMTVLFILSGWFIDSWYTLLIYTIGYIVYLIIKKEDINKTIKNLKELMEN